ncbi:MAG: hypothetical protein WCP36_00740 [Methanomicrobiales archaeon]
MKTLLLILVMVLVIAASGTVCASQGATVTISPTGVTLLPGSTVTYEIAINTLPAGLSGYQMDFQLTNPSAAQITRVSFPAWAKLNNATSLPAGRVTLSALDFGKAIEDGAAGTTLVRVTVEAVAAGTTTAKLQNIRIDDDHGGYINPDTTTAQLVVKPGGVSVTSSVTGTNTTITPVITSTPGVTTSSTTLRVRTPVPTTTVETPVALTVTSNLPAGNSGEEGMVPSTTSTSLFAKIPRWILYAIGIVALIAGLSLLFLAVTKRI